MYVFGPIRARSLSPVRPTDVANAIIAMRCRRRCAAIKSPVHYARLEPREWISKARLAVRACWYILLSLSNIHEERRESTLASTVHPLSLLHSSRQRVMRIHARRDAHMARFSCNVKRTTYERPEMEPGVGNRDCNSMPSCSMITLWTQHCVTPNTRKTICKCESFNPSAPSDVDTFVRHSRLDVSSPTL